MSTETSSALRRSDGPPAGAKSVWLDALTDPVAGVQADGKGVQTLDLFADGEWRLVVADKDKKLKVWRGTHLASEHTLLDRATAIASFYTDSVGCGSSLPSLAVTAGPHVYIYRNLRPYYKFTLALEPTPARELDVWKGLAAGTLPLCDALTTLGALQKGGHPGISSRSADLLSLGEESAQERFVEQHKGLPLVGQTVITCMSVIRRGVDEPSSPGNLLLGMESGHVVLLDNSCTKEARKLWVGEVPVFIVTHGVLDVECKVFVAARDGKVYSCKNCQNPQVLIELEAQAVGIAKVGRLLVVGCMNHVVHAYDFKGQKQYSLYLPSFILALTAMEVTGQRMMKCVVLALKNGEVRVYHEKHLASIHIAPSPVTGLYFGKYGREDNTLITIMKNGSLDIKMLPRMANLEASSSMSGPPPEQEMPLPIPKKTKLYIDQAQREVEQAGEMHRIFQKDLCKLRLQAARAYVKVLTDGSGPLSFASYAQVQLNAVLQGLGPAFKLVIEVKNTSSRPLEGLIIVLKYNELQYKTDRKIIHIPSLLPPLPYCYNVLAESLVPGNAAGELHVAVVHGSSVVPVLLALVKMPASEIEDIE